MLGKERSCNWTTRLNTTANFDAGRLSLHTYITIDLLFKRSFSEAWECCSFLGPSIRLSVVIVIDLSTIHTSLVFTECYSYNTVIT